MNKAHKVFIHTLIHTFITLIIVLFIWLLYIHVFQRDILWLDYLRSILEDLIVTLMLFLSVLYILYISKVNLNLVKIYKTILLCIIITLVFTLAERLYYCAKDGILDPPPGFVLEKFLYDNYIYITFTIGILLGVGMKFLSKIFGINNNKSKLFIIVLAILETLVLHPDILLFSFCGVGFLVAFLLLPRSLFNHKQKQV